MLPPAKPIAYPPSPGSTLITGSGQEYKLQSLLNSGAHGHVYRGECLDETTKTHQSAAIKVPHLDTQQFTFDEVNRRIGTILLTFQREFDASKRLSDIKGIVRSLDSGICACEVAGRKGLDSRVVLLPFLVQELVSTGTTLDQWCQDQFGITGKGFHGVPDPETWWMLCRGLLEIVSQMHDRRFVHRDIWPKNILVTDRGTLRLIDMGTSFDESRSLRMNGDSNSMHPYLAPECLADGNAQQAVYWPADIYSVGSVLFFLASGLPAPSPFSKGNCGALKSKTQLRAEVRDAVGSRNVLLVKEFGIVEAILLCMRPKANERLSARAVLASTFKLQSIVDVKNAVSSDKRFEERKRDVLKELDEIDIPGANPILRTLSLRVLEKTLGCLRQSQTRIWEVSGSREEIVDGFLAVLATIDRGDSITGLTSHLFWEQQNMGPDGRILAMLKTAATRGADVSWCLLVPQRKSNHKTKGGTRSGKIDKIIDAQKRLGREVRAETGTANGGIAIREVSRTKIQKLRRERLAFILLNIRKTTTLVIPEYFSERGQIASLRFCAEPADVESMKMTFEEFKTAGTQVKTPW